MKVCVVGAGAVGGLLAAALERAGADVSVLARGATLEAIGRDGLRIDADVIRPTVASDAEALGTQDFVFIALKAPALVEAAPRLAPLVAPATRIVAAMNGVPWWFFADGPRVEAVDPGGVVSAVLSARQAIGCVVHLSSSSPAPAVIRRGRGNRLIVGHPAGEADLPTRRIATVLREGGVDVELSADIRRDVWEKLWGNMSVNPVSALTLADAARIHADAGTLRLLRAMMEEHEAVGLRLGLRMSMSIDERIAVTRQLGPFRTSTLQDLEAGKPLETEALLGAVVEIGHRVGVAMPFSSAVLGLLRVRTGA